MSNQTVEECEGILTDTDAGLLPGYYDHNEDLTFTICITASDSILMTFGSFCTEASYDFISFYDGPDANSPSLGTYSGDITIPPILATNGCLTVHFTSDANVSCTGWVASWETFIPEPEPPAFTFNPAVPTCSTSTVTVTFDQQLPCDSVYPAAFQLSGQPSQTITNITPLNCSGGTADQYEIDLDPGLDESGTYGFTFTYHYTDECGEEYTLVSSNNLSVVDCPLEVEIEATEQEVCPGSCTELTAVVSGGDPNTYTYTWSHSLPDSEGPHEVCPISTTVYTLTVDDAGPATAASADITITVLDPPNFQSPPVVCRNDAPFNLSATPLGGEWSGEGIIDPNAGTFDPTEAGSGDTYATYTAPNGCFDSVMVTVKPIWAGPDEASCPGAPNFDVSGFAPVGGTWSGSNITPLGNFNPSAPGSYTVTYDAPNGCSDDKTINVENISIQADQTVCRTDEAFNLSANPYGGTWSGPGIEHQYNGLFHPDSAGPGNHTITYTMNGCSEQVDIFVKNIHAGGNIVACPDEAPFIVYGNPTPAGGTWSGIGIIDPNSGMYNPGVTGGNLNDTLTYSANGCTAEKIVYVRQTDIGYNPIEFCSSDDPLTLNWPNTHRQPGGGTWSGPGITNPNANGTFEPALAGPGSHVVYYSANNCTDSTIMLVHPNPQMNDTAMCSIGSPFDIPVSPSGGNWSGDGIIDDVAGTFSPLDAGLGNHTVRYQSPAGCMDSIEVNIYELQAADFTGLALTYCFSDMEVPLTGTPVGGSFSGNGMTDTVFNPALAGDGAHVITYTFGAGNCEVSEEQSVTVHPIISTEMELENDSICRGEVMNISVNASGGNGSLFNYDWSNGLGYGDSKVVQPDFTTTYYVTVSDGCSDDAVDSVQIFVHQPFTPVVQTSDTLCYDEMGYAIAEVQQNGNYSYLWHTSPPQTGQNMEAPASHDYTLTITEQNSGCSQDTTVRIPGYPYLNAKFSPNPDGECVPISDPSINFTDLSSYGITGNWDFGDGATDTYAPGYYPQHTYADTGTYTVMLTIENEGGCRDTFFMDVCIHPEYKLFIPNAFSPNGDNLNDIFKAEGKGIIEFSMDIYSRWGEKITTLNHIDDGWDGTYRGSVAPNGVYAYYAYVKVMLPVGHKFLRLEGTFNLLRGER